MVLGRGLLAEAPCPSPEGGSGCWGMGSSPEQSPSPTLPCAEARGRSLVPITRDIQRWERSCSRLPRGRRTETLAHGVTLLIQGLILQPGATGLAHSPATTAPKHGRSQSGSHLGAGRVPPGSRAAPSTRKRPSRGIPLSTRWHRVGTGRGRWKNSNIKYLQKARAGLQPPRRALGGRAPILGGLNAPGGTPPVGMTPLPGGCYRLVM